MRALAINPKNGYVFAGASDGIYRSTDVGENMNLVMSLPNNFTWLLAIDSQGHVFAGTEKSGVLRSIDNGVTWEPINSGLPHLDVRALALNDSMKQIFAGTNGKGVFVATLKTSVQESAQAMPSSFELAQNHPNPFNPSTTIAFSLSRASHVTLKIFNALGEEIATLVDEKRNAGRHQVVWEAKGVASGIYFYHLQSEQGALTRKMILVR